MLEEALRKVFSSKNQGWTFLSQVSRMFSGIIFIFIVVRLLEAQALGYWYKFSAVFGMASLAEMGMRQVYSRHITYANATRNNNDGSQLNAFVRQGHGIYARLSFLVATLAITGGTWWLFGLKIFSVPEELMAWTAYVFGGAIMVYSIYYSAVISGLGQLWIIQKISVICSVLSIFLLFALSFLIPSGVLLPVASYCLVQVTSLILSQQAAKNIYSINNISPFRSENVPHKLSDVLKRDLSAALLTMVGYQILTSGFILTIGKSEDNSVVGSYGLTMQVITVVLTLASTWSIASFNDLAAAYKSDKKAELGRIFWNNLQKTGAFSLFGLLLCLLLAQPALEVLKAKTTLLPTVQLTALVIMVWIEFMLGQFAQFLFACGDLRISYYSIIGSVVICGMAYLLLANECSLSLVFASRLVVYIILIGLPSLMMSKKYLIGK